MAVPAKATAAHTSHFPLTQCFFVRASQQKHQDKSFTLESPLQTRQHLTLARSSAAMPLDLKNYIIKGNPKWKSLSSSLAEPEMLKNSAFDKVYNSNISQSLSHWPGAAPHLHSSSTITYIPKRHVGGLLHSVYPKRASLGNIKSLESN